MLELQHSARDRFQEVQSLVADSTQEISHGKLKDQEKARCDKENVVLTIMKNNKSLQSGTLKIAMYHHSFAIMKIIDAGFQYQLATDLQKNYLNDLVCLYKKFFDGFEDRFCFKIKMGSLIRPTNHNLIFDLVKYLIDFSRDYYQQILFWHNRMPLDLKSDEELKQPPREVSIQEPPALKDKSISLIKPGESLPKYTFKKLESTESIRTKCFLPKIYDCLDIVPLSSVPALEKVVVNIDPLRIKMNELYREEKNRNGYIKQSIREYAEGFSKNQTTSRPTFFKQEIIYMNRGQFPIKIGLNIEKNGFTSINVSVAQANKHYQKAQSSPLKITQRAFHSEQLKRCLKPDYSVSSLRVLRLSENFLPPLISKPKPCLNETSNERLPKIDMLPKISQQSSVAGKVTISQRKMTYSEKKKKNRQKDSMSQITQESNKEEYEVKIVTAKKQLLPQAVKLQKTTNPEEKIIEWLDRIKSIKNIERKKIMGLS